MENSEQIQELLVAVEQVTDTETAIKLGVAMVFQPEQTQMLLTAINSGPQPANGEFLIQLLTLLMPLILKLFGL